MKHLFFVLCFILIKGSYSFAQKSLPTIYDIVSDSNGDPMYYRYQIIIKFDPLLVNKSKINNQDFQTGILSDFVDSNVLATLVASEFNLEDLSDLETHKIFEEMTSNDTISITRIGDTIENGKPWSALLVYLNIYDTNSIESICDSLANFYPIVQFCHPNFFLSFTAAPNDPKFYYNQLSLYPNGSYPNASVNVESAWDYSTGQDHIKIGIFDSGIKYTHEDFGDGTLTNNQVKGGKDYSVVPNTPLSSTDVIDHGTEMAGIVGAIRNNGVGIAGIAGGNSDNNSNGVSLYTMKLTTDNDFVGVIPVSVAADALRQGCDFSSSFGFGLHVANCSWGYKYGLPINDDNLLSQEIRNAFKNGVLVSTSRGNQGYNIPFPPSTYRDGWVVSVGASDEDGDRTSGNFGSNMDVIAPSIAHGQVGITYTTCGICPPGTNYNVSSGTSPAAAHVSGVDGLMMSYINSTSNNNFINLAPEDVEFLMQKYATHVSAASGYDVSTGWGRLNASNIFSHIDNSQFHIRHYKASVWANTATYQSTGVVTLAKPYGIVPKGTYSNVEKYRIQTTYYFSLPWGTTIENYWVRNSSSNLWADASILDPEPDVKIISITSNSIVVEG